jgi:hypothetical protein
VSAFLARIKSLWYPVVFLPSFGNSAIRDGGHIELYEIYPSIAAFRDKREDERRVDWTLGEKGAGPVRSLNRSASS